MRVSLPYAYVSEGERVCVGEGECVYACKYARAREKERERVCVRPFGLSARVYARERERERREREREKRERRERECVCDRFVCVNCEYVSSRRCLCIVDS
jgi:hypothetical protein